MRPGGSVILGIDNEDGLQQSKWRCFVHKGGTTKKIMLRLGNDAVRLSFQPRSLQDPESIFWCADKALEQRSNQIVVRTSGNIISCKDILFGLLIWLIFLLNLQWGTSFGKERHNHIIIYLPGKNTHFAIFAEANLTVAFALVIQAWLVGLKNITDNDGRVSTISVNLDLQLSPWSRFQENTLERGNSDRFRFKESKTLNLGAG